MNRISAAGFVRPKNIAIGLLILAAGGRASAAEPDHWYVAGAVTGSALNKPRQTIANAPTPGSTIVIINDVDFGWGGQGAIGYAGRLVRIEAEIGRTANHSDSYSAISPITVTVPQSGKNSVTRYMANAYLEPRRDRWPVSPFLGAGIGMARAHVTTFAAPARAPTAPPSQLIDFKQSRFAYQLMGGIGLPVTHHATLTAQYRWFDGGTFDGVDSRGERATRRLRGSNFDVGLRVGF